MTHDDLIKLLRSTGHDSVLLSISEAQQIADRLDRYQRALVEARQDVSLTEDPRRR